MINNDLLDKFDRIQDLPISEEMLGAYMENNLNETESALVLNTIDSDLSLMNLSHEVSSGLDWDNKWEYDNYDESSVGMEIPEIRTDEVQPIETVDDDSCNFSSPDLDDFTLPDIDDYLPDGDSYDLDSCDE
jgi:hypothetical protein